MRVAVALLVVVALVLIERSALVGLEEVQVAGTERLDPDEVREAAGLQLGTSTLRLRLATVERRVRQLPLVGEVDARRVDPLTVRITVEERLPALRARGEGHDVLLDREGVAIAPGDGSVETPRDLPRIDLPGPVPALGERPDPDAPVAAGVRLWRELTGPLRAEITRISVSGGGELRARLRDGTEVWFGPADRIDEKARALGAVLEDLEGTPVQRIDVTAPGRPAVRP